ncbi:MAG: hypothetical protein KDA41_14180, partial [Planctomycetales bacterium]|nr:hypothetical protein [Planctomycetales bacterium]
AEADIAKIEAWIAAGAKFDGPSTTAPVERVAALVKATTATHEELSAEREQIAGSNWRLALPGVESKSISTKNFLVMGNLGEEALAEVGAAAEATAPEVAKVFAADPDAPLVKGRLTLFAFPQRYDYAEFGQMVEKRKLPTQWYGHWSYDTVDAYGCLVPSRSGKYSANALIAQQLAGVYVASCGSPPRWFAEGSARAVAARLAATDSRVKAWDEALPSALGAMTAADDFMTGKIPEEEAMLAAYSFAKFLMKDARRYQKLLDDLRDGGEFDAVFVQVYGGTPAQVAASWAPRAIRGR